MNILVIGSGSIGCSYSVALASAGAEVTLVVRRPEKAALLRQIGLTRDEMKGGIRQVFPHIIAEPAEAEHPDLVLLSAKAYATADIAAQLQAMPGDFPMLCVQNGLDNEELLCAALDPRRVFTAISYQGAIEDRPGHVFHTGNGDTVLAPAVAENLPQAQKIAALLNDAGVSAKALPREEFLPIFWTKLLLNSVVNPISAVYSIENSQFLREDLHLRMDRMIKEGVAVANARGVEITTEDVWLQIRNVTMYFSRNRTSMLRDIELHRKTEINEITGSVVRWGQRLGIPTPELERICREVESLEKPVQN